MEAIRVRLSVYGCYLGALGGERKKNMKRAVMLTFVTALMAACAQAQLGTGVRLSAEGKSIDVEIGHLVPTVVDWNGDGKKDLIVGQFSNGAIRLYLNEGTDAEPRFGKFTYLEAGDKPIRLDAG
jgi:hypothetical protein